MIRFELTVQRGGCRVHRGLKRERVWIEQHPPRFRGVRRARATLLCASPNFPSARQEQHAFCDNCFVSCFGGSIRRLKAREGPISYM